MKLPGDLEGGLILFGLAAVFSAIPLYVMRKTRAFKATKVLQLRQSQSYVWVGMKVNGKNILAMYDTGKYGDLSIPESLARTIPGLTGTGTPISSTRYAGIELQEVREEYNATIQIGDGPPLTAKVDVGSNETPVLLGPRLVAESGYTPVLTMGNPRFVPQGMTTVAAVEVPLERDPGTTGPTHIPFVPMVKINGKTVQRMRYDTGASVTVLLFDEARRLGIGTRLKRPTVTMQIGDTKPFTTRIGLLEQGFNSISTADAQKAGYTAVWSAMGPRLVPKGTTITA